MANRPGLWANIRAKRARGEKMRKKGEKGAPTPDQIKRAQGKSESPEIGGVKMKKLGSNPGSYKRLVKKHLGKSPDEKITKSDGDKIIAIAKKKGDKELAKKGSFIKNVIAEDILVKTFQQYLNEKRRNPELNPKIGILDALEPYKNDPNIYISFVSDVGSTSSLGKNVSGSKIGINPKSDYNTPNGIYTYPLKEAWGLYADKSKGKLDVPFAGEQPFVYVVKAKNPRKIINLQTYSSKDFDRDYMKLAKIIIAFLTKKNRKWSNAFAWECAKALLNHAQEISKDRSVGGQFWSMTRLTHFMFHDNIIFSAFYKDFHSDKIDFNDKKINVPITIKYMSTPSSNTWNKIMRDLGYDAVADKSGKGIIHPAEPIQAVFFHTGAFKVLGSFENKSYKFRTGPKINATVDSEYTISEIDDEILWKDGTWLGGTWSMGTWEDGTWLGGTWEDGIWEDGTWKKGTWKDGTWLGGTWEDGTWHDGFWIDGTWLGGKWINGKWKDGKILNPLTKKLEWSDVNPNEFYKQKNVTEGALDKSSQPQYGKGIGGKDEKKQKKAFDRNKKRYAKNPDDPRAFEPTAVDKAIMKKRKEGKMKDAPKSRYSENVQEAISKPHVYVGIRDMDPTSNLRPNNKMKGDLILVNPVESDFFENTLKDNIKDSYEFLEELGIHVKFGILIRDKRDEKKLVDAIVKKKSVMVKGYYDDRVYAVDTNENRLRKTLENYKVSENVSSKLDENQKALANKAKESGEPLGVLKKVYKRGLAAYASGHRPGMTQHQWAMARVNSYIKGGKARTVDKDLREHRLSFKEFIAEAPADEIKVGGYQTSHHYMCPSAVKFLKKHMRMDHDVQDLEDIARLSDDVFKIEADVEKAGKSTDEQVKSAQRLTNMVYDIVKKMGHKKEEASYMDLHMDAIKNPDKAGSMKA